MGMQPFEGREVIKSGMTLPGASGGLNKALAVDELEKHIGDKFTVAIDVEVRDVSFKGVKDTQALERVTVLTIDNATIIDRDIVAEALEAQRERVEQAGGVHRLQYEDGDEPDDPDAESAPEG